MFTKLLLTVTVIIVVLLLFRSKRATNPAAPQSAPASTRGDSKKAALSPARLSAWILIAVIATVTITVTAWQWLGSRDTVTIRVINSNTGNSVSYQAYQHQTGKRSFSTVDGRTITLAEVERMEIGPGSAD